MKRFLSIILTIGILLSIIGTLPVTVSAKTYSAIAKVDWNGHTYHIYDESMTWEEAKIYCENSGGHLVTITSEEENNVISNLISNSNYNKSMYWIGGYKDGDWKWVTGENMQYTNWNYGEPTNTQECIAMYTSLATQNIDGRAVHGEWLDNPNNGVGSWSISKTGFICEWDGEPENNSYGKMYKITPFYTTIDAFEIIESESHCESTDVTGKTVYVDGKCILKAAQYVDISIYKLSDGTTLQQFCEDFEVFEGWRSIRPDYILSTMTEENQNTSQLLQQGSYVVEVISGGDGVFTYVQVGDSSNESDEIKVNYNGTFIQMTEQKPIIVEGTTLVPIREVLEAMGMKVSWNNSTQEINVSGKNTTISIKVGRDTAKVNGKEVQLRVAPTLHNSKTMVPIRFIEELR